ncbi:hypothetical protein HGRIS_011316 [Hohenbuehelia grisea]|uniref:DUF6535 domain-containing protein n=1 Tax=Hohenbuehelia grisea TaxID=104357 RepID=A0ABR3JWX7_9AGAR
MEPPVGSLPKNEEDDETLLYSVIRDLKGLMKEQNTILRQINQQQKTSETIIPVTVPSRSISAWDPLLQSFNQNIHPIIERWRRNLDTTLIFVGLFSAIITAFFVESLNAVKPDEAARTNELIANLTEIMIMLGTSGFESQRIAQPTLITPDGDDERFNFYCAISLIVSISIAAVAVACHAFVSSMARAQGDTIARLTELHQRWASAKRILGPGIEAIPQILVLPVAIFALGLMDKLFSSAIHLPKLSVSMLLAAAFASLGIVILGLAMALALVHGLRHPDTSPFRTSLFVILGSLIPGRSQDGPEEPSSNDEPDEKPLKSLTSANCEVFHLVLQETFDDQWLDRASAALSSIMIDYFRAKSSFLSFTPLSRLELDTLLHLLSAEASLQSNITAATVIAESGVLYYYWDSEHNRMGIDPTQRALLLQALVRASKHALPIGVHSPEWHMKSPFIHAMAVLINYPKAQDSITHPLLRVLSANSLKEAPSSVLVRVCGEASSYAILLIKEAIKQQLGNPRAFAQVSEANVNSAVQRVFGNYELEAHDAQDIVLSLIHRPKLKKYDQLSRFNQINWSSTRDHKIVIAGLVRWLSVHPCVLKAVTSFVDDVSPQFFHATHENQVYKAHNLLLVILNTLSVHDPESLSLCSAFLLKACSTYSWHAGADLTLSMISKFLALLVQHMPSWVGDPKQQTKTLRALAMVHGWIKSNFEIGSHLSQMSSTYWDFFTEESILERIEQIWSKIQSFPGVAEEDWSLAHTTLIPPVPTTGIDVMQRISLNEDIVVLPV